jgi:hypothetical protein
MELAMIIGKHRGLAYGLAAAVLLAPVAARAAACLSTEFVGDRTANGSCYGTTADSTVRFLPTDPAAQFSTSGAFGGTGSFATPVLEQVGASIFASANAFGSLSARGNIVGVAPGGTASAATSSDLLTGALRLSGTVESDDLQSAVANGFFAQAKLSDTLSLSIPKTLVDPTIVFNLDVDGVITGSGPVGGQPGIVQAQLLITSLDGTISYLGSPDFQANALGSHAETLSVAIQSLQGAEDAGDFWLLTVQLDAQLFALGDPNYSFDFSNTAQLRFELSDGITFTSGSGVLLAGPGDNHVPEPSTALLAVLAIGLASATAGRRRGGRQCPPGGVTRPALGPLRPACDAVLAG